MLSKREKNPKNKKPKAKHTNPSSSNQNKTPQKSQPKTQASAFHKAPKPIQTCIYLKNPTENLNSLVFGLKRTDCNPISNRM